MKSYKRVIGIAALLMCISMAAGCGKDADSETASAANTGFESSMAEGTDVVTGESATDITEITDSGSESSGAEETSASGIPGYVKIDINAAEVQEPKAVVTEYLDAVVNADIEKMIDLTQMRELIERSQESENIIAEKSGREPADIEAEYKEHLSDSADNVQSYEIINVYKVPDIEEKLSDYLDEMDDELKDRLADAEQDEAEELKKQYGLMRELLTFDEMYLFDTDLISKDGTEEYPVVLINRNGKWHVDASIAPSMVSYVNKSKITSANASAKSLKNAGSAALTDLDCEDIDLSLLTGDYRWNGSDFENLAPVQSIQTKEDAEASFMYRIWQYFNDVTKLDAVMLHVENGNVTATAVQYGKTTSLREGERDCFGAFPNPILPNADDKPQTLEEALDWAKKEN